MKVIKSRELCPLRKLFRQVALKRVAKALVVASESSVAAGDDILYRLPGVFSLMISYEGSSVRLIKEANAFRIMGPSEKSEVLLAVTIADSAALGDLMFRSATWQKVYAEGRATFAGKVKYATLLLRVAAEGDKATLSPEKYQALYGE